jgi:hypothetical protein
LSITKEAGSKGASVPELAKKLGMKKVREQKTGKK